MLKSLYINNYRCLKDFKIDSLERVNLITGKNNTGKSSVLEALVIYASKGNTNKLKDILREHGEYIPDYFSAEDKIDTFAMLSSLFYKRKVEFNEDGDILIGGIENKDGVQLDLFKDNIRYDINEDNLSLKFVKYYDDIQKDEAGQIVRSRKFISSEDELNEYKVGLRIAMNGVNDIFLPLDEDFFRSTFYFNRITNIKNFQHIKTSNIDRDENGALFDKITLSDKEKYVVEALQIIEPDTERIAFVEAGPKSRLRTPVIKLKNSKEIVPLKSMGDGINRILTIILALIHSENGYLMIDEFENGLHYSVQNQLWEIIFDLSEKLNVQVFATTHSNDCIYSFQRVLNGDKDNNSGQLIRLENIDGSISHIEYTAEELRIASEQNIETR